MDDWERALEEDRRRMAAGQDVPTAGRRAAKDDDVDTGAYTAAMSYEVDDGRRAAPSLVPSAPSADDYASVEAFYAQYEGAQGSGGSVASGGGALTPVMLQAGLRATFGSKFGRHLYFCESVSVALKGFFSPNIEPFVMFLTLNGLYWGDGQTGELVLGRALSTLIEVLVMGDTGVGLRFRGACDICMTMPVGRGQFIVALPSVCAAAGVAVPISTRSADFEKGYRKDIKYLGRKELVWEVFEDPRTSLPLVFVPEKHVPFYTPLLPKIMHWFGGVNYITKDWKGGLVQERRGCWITATSLYLSQPAGPQTDGRDITRCIGVEFIGEVLNGVGGALAIITNAGPKQPPLTLMYDDMQTKERVITVLREIFWFRKLTELKVTRVDSIDKAIKIEKASDKKEKPELFVMKTRDDLLALLRAKSAPTAAKK